MSIATSKVRLGRERDRAIPSAALPRWRTARGFAGHKLIGHAEQVSQRFGIDARQANQHRTIADVVVCYIVNIGIGIKQFGAVIEIHADDERSGFGRAISGDTRQEFSIDLEGGKPYAVLSCTPGSASAISRTVSKLIVGLGISGAHCSSLPDMPGASFRMPILEL